MASESTANLATTGATIAGTAFGGPIGGALAGAGASALFGGKGGSRKSPLQGDIETTQRSALQFLRGDIEGAQPLATAGTQSLLGLLGGGLDSGSLGVLGDLITTGAPTDLSPLFQSATELSRRNVEQSSAELGQSFGPTGLRFSSDRIRQERLLRERALQDLNDRILGISAGAAEAAAGRRLSATGLLSNIALGSRASALSPVQSALGVELPDILPSELSQAVTTALPALVFGLTSNKTGGK